MGSIPGPMVCITDKSAKKEDIGLEQGLFPGTITFLLGHCAGGLLCKPRQVYCETPLLFKIPTIRDYRLRLLITTTMRECRL